MLVSLHPLQPQLLSLLLRDSDGGGFSGVENLGHGTHEVLGIVCQHLACLLISFLIYKRRERERERECPSEWVIYIGIIIGS